MSARYVWRRLLQVLPVVAGIVTVGFVLVHLAPGDPVLAIAGQDGDAAYYAAMRAKFGLDQPLLTQFATYLGNVIRGDLGTSVAQGRQVTTLIAERLPATLLLTVTALVVSSISGVIIGVFTARRHQQTADTAVSVLLLTTYAAPVFWLGQLSLIVLALWLDLFPVQGMVSARSSATGLSRYIDIGWHLVLPVSVLAVKETAVVARLLRPALVEQLALPYARTARAKGLTTRRIVWVHALRRALLPAVSIVGARVGHLFAGTVIVEIIFGWPGIGRLLLTAIQSRDHPVLLGLFLLIAFSVIIANLITDFVYTLLDPRITYA